MSGWLVFLHFLQEPLDALDVLLREIQREMQFRHPPQLQPLDKFPADKAGGMLQRLDRLGLLLLDPFTLMNTRACFMPGCTRTSLATTLPSSRGSFSSPASMALISCAISSPTRS